MDLDPKGANNQIKEAIDKRYLPEDEGETGIQTVKQDWKFQVFESSIEVFLHSSLFLPASG